MMSEYRVAKTSDIPPGQTKAFHVDEIDVLVCNVDGSFYAIEDICTHDGGRLDQGEVEGSIVVCPRHGATFDVRTGEALTLPAVMPVMTFAVRVDGDDLYVEA
jgi:3-phenylpropionate/trans-cinnamate dioxygenase ferredoxin component